MRQAARGAGRGIGAALVAAGLALFALAGGAAAAPSLHISVAPAQPLDGDGVWLQFGMTGLPGDTPYMRWSYTRGSYFLFSLDGVLFGDGQPAGSPTGLFGLNGCSSYKFDAPGDCIATIGRMIGPYQLALGSHTARLEVYRSAISGLSADGLDPVEFSFDVLPKITLGDGGKVPKKTYLDLPFVDPFTLPTGDLVLVDGEDGTGTVLNIAALRTVLPDGTPRFALPFDLEPGTIVRYAGDANNAAFEFAVGVPAPAAPFVLALAMLGLVRRRR